MTARASTKVFACNYDEAIRMVLRSGPMPRVRVATYFAPEDRFEALQALDRAVQVGDVLCDDDGKYLLRAPR